METGPHWLGCDKLVGAKAGVDKAIDKGGCQIGSSRVHGRPCRRAPLHQMRLVHLCTTSGLLIRQCKRLELIIGSTELHMYP